MKKALFCNLLAVCCVVLVIIPCGASDAGDAVVLGMSTAMTGPTAELGLRMRDGVLLGLERANLEGGVQGRRLALRAYDDGYEPYRVAPNIQRLIDVDHALAIIGNVGTPTAVAALPLIKNRGVPFVAPFSGARLLRKTPPERYVINFRASYVQEVTAMLDGLINQGGVDPQHIAFFSQRDSYGDAGFVGGVSALKRHGLDDVSNILHVRYERNTLAVENALADLVYSSQDIQAVIMVGAYAPCAKFIRLAKEVGLNALFLNVSFVGSELLLDELGNDSDGVIVTQVVPPLIRGGPSIVCDYLTDFKRFNQSGAPNYVGFEGYVASRLLFRALKKIEGPLTHDAVIDALEGMGTFDLG
ncbi:ABC transporter substrate-binding protein [uncultured Desulfuromonas sp.]|uniref:ABC transporter substrate-binding protein n=1 Tax=uncultured Desulfuromonas sp. TaxID=181013 RepID=UPI002AAA8F23|nr:ABC transporter substrate-binding protein [uncultured Desulfuromonas sp.]